MANFTAGTSFTDGVTNDVTAAKLNALVADAVPTSSLSLNSTTGTISLFSSGTGTAATPAIQPAGDTNTGIFFPAADTIAFSEGGTESMRIDSSGNVGIGISPSQKLDVNGASAIRGTLFIGDGSSSLIRKLTSSTPLTFANNAGSAEMTIDSSGNVGVGTASPASKLHLGSGDIRLENGNYIVWGGLSNGISGNAAQNLVSVNTNGTERLRIDSSGNVGIGTTTPDDKLDVNGFAVLGTNIGTGQTSTKFHKFKGTAVQSTASWFGSYGGLLLDAEESLTAAARKFLITNSLTGNKFAIIRSTTATTDPSLGDAGAITSGTADFVITNTGDIGIGTTNPATKLEVNGSTRIGSGNDYQWNSTLKLSAESTGTSGYIRFYTNTLERLRIDGSGNVGIGTISPSAQLELSTDSAKKPSTNTWTIASDQRLKTNITTADNDRCYEIVKQVPLKRYTWRSEVYSQEQVKDRSKLGWIAQDVEAVFPKAVGTNRFAYNQVFEDVVTPELDSDGNAVLDENGVAKTKTEKRLVSEDVIEDCKDLNSDQIYAAMYGTIQKLIEKVELLESKVATLEAA